MTVPSRTSLEEDSGRRFRRSLKPFASALTATGLAAAIAMAGVALAQVRPPPGRVVGNAQPACQSGRFSISADGREGVLDLRISSNDTIWGSVFGESIEGYYARRQGLLVWLRGESITEDWSQAFVARCSSGIRPNSSAMIGVVYALNGAGGATAQRNAFAFRAWQPFAILPRQPPSHPAISQTPLADPKGAWWATADAVNSGMVIEVDTKGAVSGWMDGGPIVGHYASEAGTIAFVRFECVGADCARESIQFYEGKSVGTDASPRFEGRVYGLEERHTPASANGASFIAANHEPEFYTYESQSRLTDCLDVNEGIIHNRADLQFYNCDSTSTNQHLAVLVVGPNGAESLVMRHSGKCLDVPDGSTTAGMRIQQYRCHGGTNQQVDFESGTRIRFRHSDLCIGHDPNAGLPDLARQIECGARSDFRLRRVP